MNEIGGPSRSGTLYGLIRQTLAAGGGRCSKGDLLSAILADPVAAQRLARSQGFARLLDNMRHDGFIEVEGQLVLRTRRKVGRRHL